MSDRAEFDARGWLDAHMNLETGVGVPPARPRGAPTLERVSTLLRFLGSPEEEFAVVHITGTNGKTSVARMVSQLLQSLGMRVGTYTSPHLERLNERFAIDGEFIDDETLDEMLYAVSLVERSVDVDPSYFDVITAAAFRWFADEAVDVAVVEVGLGGTWDTTNVVNARVAVVTNISLDHTEVLGTTREAIAGEKSGIVKPGSTLVLGETDPALQSIFEARKPAHVVLRERDFGVRNNVIAHGGRLLDLFTPRAAYPDVFLDLHGAYQGDNAAIALAAAEELVEADLDRDVVAEAFATVRSPGRLEVVGRSPLVLLDGAHNVAGAESLRFALDEEFGHRGARTVVIGMMRDRDPHELLAAIGLDDVDGLLVCCRSASPRAHDPAVIGRAARDLGFPEDRLEVAETVQAAIGTALFATPEDGQIVVTGSLYVVGAARELLVKDE
jgi:dihydrofolate synthase/folylpolyglutamate synthase